MEHSCADIPSNSFFLKIARAITRPAHLIVVTGLITQMFVGTCLVSCKTTNRTHSRNKSLKTGVGKATNKPTDPDPATHQEASGGEIDPDVHIVDSDFVRSKSLEGFVLSGKAPAFQSLSSGHILVPVCPGSDVNCTSPSIYVFDLLSRSITHIIKPSGAFIPHATGGGSMIVGLIPDGASMKFGYIEASFLLAPPAGSEIMVETPPDVTPIPVDVTVIANGVSASSGRPINCRNGESICFIPEVTGCGTSDSVIRSFIPMATYTDYCKAYPSSKTMIGFTANNEIVYSSVTPTQKTLSFDALPAPVGVDSSALPEASLVKEMQLRGESAAEDQFSFIDDVQQNLFAFLTVSGKNCWTVIDLSKKIIRGIINLDFAMSGRGLYFASFNGSIVEVRPSSGSTPPAIYLLDMAKIYSKFSDSLLDDTSY